LGSSEIKLVWTDNSTDETGFNVERRTGEEGTFIIIDSTGKNTTDWTDNDIEDGVKYYYRVCAFNNVGNSGYTNEVEIVTTLNNPTDLTIIDFEDNPVKLSWTDNSQNEMGYIIERSQGNNELFSIIAEINASNTTFTDEAISPKTQYHYKIKAFNNITPSTYSNEVGLTTTDNLIKNGKLADSLNYWKNFLYEGVQTSFNVDENGLSIDIVDGGTEPWHVQLIQQNLLIEEGKKYDVLFDASSSLPRVINVGVGEDKDDYTPYFDHDISLSEEMKSYNFTAVMLSETDSSARLVIGLGGQSGNVKLKNLIIREHIIQKSITIESPTVADEWMVGNTYNIAWQTTEINKINLYYSLSKTANWTSIFKNINAENKKISWKIPSVKSDSCQIKIEDVDDNSVYSISPTFYIKNPTSTNMYLQSNNDIKLKCYPNPFKQKVSILISIPANASNYHGDSAGLSAMVVIYNSSGEKVIAFIEEISNAGEHEIKFDATILPDGIYLCKISIGDETQATKLLKIN
jgi:hypothetical protein